MLFLIAMFSLPSITLSAVKIKQPAKLVCHSCAIHAPYMCMYHSAAATDEKTTTAVSALAVEAAAPDSEIIDEATESAGER